MTIRNETPGRMGEIIYSSRMAAVSFVQKEEILSTLQKLDNFETWGLSGAESSGIDSHDSSQGNYDRRSIDVPEAACPTNETVGNVIYETQIASNKIGRPSEVEDLIYQAGVAASPPECDIVRAKILSDKAYQLATEWEQ